MRIFEETQRFTQTWLIILITVSNIPALAVIVKQYVDKKMTLNELLLTFLLVIAATGLIFTFKLKTEIDREGIKYQFFPFHFSYRVILWKEIKKVYVRKYNAISEYGGWGLKTGFFWNKKKGVAYNVSGNVGIQIELKNNKKILIGTKQPVKVEQVLKYHQQKNNENK